jgi:hypothetical protein
MVLVSALLVVVADNPILYLGQESPGFDPTGLAVRHSNSRTSLNLTFRVRFSWMKYKRNGLQVPEFVHAVHKGVR